MIPRKEALVIVRNLREAAEKELGRSVRRTAKEADKKASTDLNSAVANGQFPYAQDRDGYPEWSFYLLRDIYPALIEGERGAGETVEYGKRAEIVLPKKYSSLIMMADFRAVLRGARKLMSSPDLIWSLFQTAFDGFDFRLRELAPVARDIENCWETAQHYRDHYAESSPDRGEVQHDVRGMIKQIQSIEEARARKLRVFDLSGPPFTA